MQAKLGRTARMRGLRALIVATLVMLTAQGWFGDTVNIFIAPADGVTPPAPTLGGFLSAITSLSPPFLLVWHTYEGVALVVLAVVVFVLSFTASKSLGVRVWATLGLLAMLSSALGGYFFVMSGFKDGGNSAQMGGSYIASYACYFLTMYYTR